jgi:two-component system sensor histidine kinase MprB
VRNLDEVRRRARAWLRGFSLRARVGLLVAVGVGLAVALTSVAAYVTVRDQLHHTRDDALLKRARAAATSPLSDPDRLAAIPPDALGAVDVRIGILPADGRGVVAPGGKPPPGDPAELAVARGELSQAIFTGAEDGQQFRVVAVPSGQGLALVFAQSTTEIEKTLDRLGLVLLLVGGVGVAAAAWAGAAIARAGLRPVERLTVAAENVAATQRLDAIEVHGSDEIARLTSAFNAMLAALAASRDRQRALVADAGHELRTPLTSLRTNLDLLAQDDRRAARAQGGASATERAQGGGVSAADGLQGGLSAVDRSELLSDVRAQVTELSELVGDLVDLAREDSPTPVREPVDLADIVARAVQRVARRAPEVHFDTECDSFVLYGDAAALERAVINLLDNAAKWSPRPGVVRTRLFREVMTGDLGNGSVRNAAVLQIRDQGSGIQPTDLPHVFDRFYRSADARALPGSGLGLAIVRQAVERHGGTVEAAAADPSFGGGTVLTVRLPSSSSEPLGPLSGSSQA